MGLQPRQDAGFEDVAPDRQKVVAGSAIASVRAAVMMLAYLREPATTGSATEQVGEQIDRTASALRANADIVVDQGMADAKLPSPHRIPELVSDDAQFRNILHDPLVRWVRSSLPLTGRRILNKALAVPNEL